MTNPTPTEAVDSTEHAGDKSKKMGLAFMVACPACAGGFILAIGAALGATARALKGFLPLAGLTLVLGLWARNYWRRRNEEDCPVPVATASLSGRAGPGFDRHP